MPDGGRFSISQSPPRRIANILQARSGTSRRGRGDGSRATDPSRTATHEPASGQRSQQGRLRVQTVAPRSISPCV